MSTEQVKVQVHLEEKPAKETPMTAYAFDAHGSLIASAPVDKEGQAALTIPSKSIAQGRLFIASTPPKERKEAVTIDALHSRAAFEVPGSLSAGVSKPITAVIPSQLIRIWPWCFCRVRGKVVRPVDVHGTTQDMPVCHARVHICRVEPLIIRIPRWPDSIIKRLREEVLAVVKGHFHPPLPDPPPELLLETSPAKIAQLQPERRVAANKLALAGGAKLAAAKPLMALQPSAPAPLHTLSLPSESLTALQSQSLATVRDALIKHAELLRPYFCYWPWLYPFLLCEEVAVLETTDQGLFDTNIIYLCFDRPDLYFWVEYFLNGVWTTVYRPPLPCYTYWNYACGSEVTITITDPRVPWCGNPTLPGKTVAIMSIGNNVSMSQIQRQSAGAAEGLTSGGEPFGGSLEPHVFFGADDLLAAGITHYKWSYRQMGTTDWKVMDTQVIRHYAMPPSGSGGGPTFLPYPLGPDPDPALTGLNLFKIQPRNVPVAGSLGWAPIDARADSATAYFLSHLEQLDKPNPAEAAQGKYELKFELFKHSAPTVPVDFTAEGITLSEATDPAPFGTGTVHTRLLPNDPAFPADPMPERVFLNGAGHVVGFRLVIHVDNNVCTADIHDVTVGGAAAGPCGFIDFPPGANAHVSFLARHPHGFGQLRFQVFKGSSGRVEVACAPSPDAGYPSLPSVNSPTVNGFTRDAGSNFSKDIPVASLLGSCPKAAFSELLYVYAMAIDGWNRLSYLDGIPSPESKAFALEPAP